MTSKLQRAPIVLLVISLTFLATVFFSGCSPRADTISETLPPVPAQTLLASPTSGSTPQPQPTAAPEAPPSPTPEAISKPQYVIQADFNYPEQRLTVQESVTLTNPADGDLEGISLAVPANNWPGVVSLQSVQSASHSVESYQLDGVVLEVTLAEPGWRPGEALELDFNFVLDLPRVNTQVGYGPSAFGYSILATNLVDWYLMVPPYQEGEGWLIHDPWIFGEYLVYPAADFKVDLRLDRPDLIAAASSLPVQEGETYHYSLEDARNFVISISPSYQVLEDEVGGIQVRGYIFPGYGYSGQAAFHATLEALDLYQRLFGPYQGPSLTMVQADFNHGVEYEGLYFLSRGFFDSYDGTNQSYLVAIAVHETAHQWWYGQVANDQALEPWLDEALCTFSELAYYEQLHPESVDWWWAVRVNFYQPYGRLDRSIYGFTQFSDQYLEYRNATYLQGAKFLAQLKTVLGEEAFYSFLQRYVELNQGQIASREDFFQLLGEYLDLDSQEWIKEYFPG